MNTALAMLVVQLLVTLLVSVVGWNVTQFRKEWVTFTNEQRRLNAYMKANLEFLFRHLGIEPLDTNNS